MATFLTKKQFVLLQFKRKILNSISIEIHEFDHAGCYAGFETFIFHSDMTQFPFEIGSSVCDSLLFLINAKKSFFTCLQYNIKHHNTLKRNF